MDKHYEPPGIRFQDARLGDCLLVTEGAYEGWVCRRHPDGQWVTVRKATDEDRAKVEICSSDLPYLSPEERAFTQRLVRKLLAHKAHGTYWTDEDETLLRVQRKLLGELDAKLEGDEDGENGSGSAGDPAVPVGDDGRAGPAG